MTETYTVESGGTSYEWLYMGATVTGQGAWRSVGRLGDIRYDMVVVQQEGDTELWQALMIYRLNSIVETYASMELYANPFESMEIATGHLIYRRLWRRLWGAIMTNTSETCTVTCCDGSYTFRRRQYTGFVLMEQPDPNRFHMIVHASRVDSTWNYAVCLRDEGRCHTNLGGGFENVN